MSIPRYPGDVTARWLTDALREHGRPVEITSVDVTAIGTGQTGATYRVMPTYAGDPGDLPATFVIKLPAQDDDVRDRVALSYRSECAFYTNVAAKVRVPTPRCFYSRISDDARDYALLLADQAPAVQGDPFTTGGKVRFVDIKLEWHTWQNAACPRSITWSVDGNVIYQSGCDAVSQALIPVTALRTMFALAVNESAGMPWWEQQAALLESVTITQFNEPCNHDVESFPYQDYAEAETHIGGPNPSKATGGGPGATKKFTMKTTKLRGSK